jgi:RNA polymerase sigma-B factor
MADVSPATTNTHPAQAANDSSDDAVTERLLAEYVVSRDLRQRDELARRYDRLVHWLAHRFTHRGAPIDDLIQMGRIGLLHALDHFDPLRGVSFRTYAVSTILGQIKHYFRDCTWIVRVPRHLQEIASSLPRVEETLCTRLNRPPTVGEIAEHLGVPEEEIVSAMELGRAYQPKSLDALMEFDDGERAQSFGDMLGRPDERVEALVEYAALRTAMNGLDERKRQILHRRFYEQWSQTEVARELGISQMHVSRLEREALSQLRALLTGEPEISSGPVGANGTGEFPIPTPAP